MVRESRRKDDALEFLLGALGTSAAGFFSNPLEVAKTRLQLQGELQRRGRYTVHYRNVFHAFATIGRLEGVLALQKGLMPALWYQFCMNGARLGSYQTFVNLGFTARSGGSSSYSSEESMAKCFLFGAISGAIGAVFGSPLYMVRCIFLSSVTELRFRSFPRQ